jgi:hypothetical protein
MAKRLGIAKRDQPLQPPWPLQSFCPLQACLSVLQPPWLLQSFCPLQACFAGVAAGAPAEGEACVAGWGLLPAHPVRPPRIPAVAATNNECATFMANLLSINVVLSILDSKYGRQAACYGVYDGLFLFGIYISPAMDIPPSTFRVWPVT